MEVGLAGRPAAGVDEQLKQSVHVSASNLSRTGSGNDWPALTSLVLIFNLSGRRTLRGENELLCCSCADRDSDGFKVTSFKLYVRSRSERREFEQTANVVLSRQRSRSSGL